MTENKSLDSTDTFFLNLKSMRKYSILEHEYAILELSQNRNMYPKLSANELQEFQDQGKYKGACFLLGLPMGERTERTEGSCQLSPESVLLRKSPGDDLS